MFSLSPTYTVERTFSGLWGALGADHDATPVPDVIYQDALIPVWRSASHITIVPTKSNAPAKAMPPAITTENKEYRSAGASLRSALAGGGTKESVFGLGTIGLATAALMGPPENLVQGATATGIADVIAVT